MMHALNQLNANLKIGARIGAGFAIVLALLLIVATTAYFGFTTIRSNFHAYSGISNNAVQVQQAATAFAEARRSVRTYLLTLKDDDAKNARETGAEAKKLIDDFAGVAEQPETKQLGIKVSGQIADYLATFDQVATAMIERQRLVERMGPSGTALLTKLSEMFDSAVKDYDITVTTEVGGAIRDLMQMRLSSVRFLLHADPKIVEEFDQSFQNLSGHVARINDANSSAERQGKMREFSAALPALVDDFHDVAKLSAQANHLVDDTLVKLAAAGNQLMKQLARDQVDALGEIRRASDSTVTSSVIWSLAVAGFALAFGGAIAWRIGRGISDPVIALCGTMEELTAGNLEADVPGTDRADEVGQMAKAVLFLRDGAIEKKKMESEALATAAVNLRVRSALDASNSNMMIADNDHNIVYMNPNLLAMFRDTEQEIRKEMPQFDSSRLLGQSIDVFHKDPKDVRATLDGSSDPHEVQIKIAGKSFQLVVVPIADGEGKRSGFVVEWRNRTAEVTIEEEVDRVVNAAVAGDLTQRVDLEGKKEFMLTLSKAMNELCDNFAKFVAEVGDTTREVKNAAAEISASTTDLSQRTEEQAASLEQTSASMEQISATVKKNAENAQRANQLTTESHTIADHGGAVVGDAVKAMARIEESSRKIGDIIGVIDEIARQTNLLALNAAVEAARAGDAGRGFAVVASEVRSLAQRSSQAAKDIKNLIRNSSSQVQEGVGLVNQAGASLTEIVGSIKQVVQIVADIASASAEQSEGLEQVNLALAQMDEVTQQNSALVEENAASAKALENHSIMMDERLASFKLGSNAEAAVNHAPSVHRGIAQVPAGVASGKVMPAAPPKAATRKSLEESNAKDGGTKESSTKESSTKQTVATNRSARSAAKAMNGDRNGAVGRMQAMVATAFRQQEPDWKEF